MKNKVLSIRIDARIQKEIASIQKVREQETAVKPSISDIVCMTIHNYYKSLVKKGFFSETKQTKTIHDKERDYEIMEDIKQQKEIQESLKIIEDMKKKRENK